MRFACSECGVWLRAKPELVGKRLPCPKCGCLLTVPAGEDTPSGAGPAVSVVDAAGPDERSRSQSEKDAAPPPASPDAVAPKMLGRYKLIQKLGQGGMGTVYEAIQQGLDRRVALKVLFRHLTYNRDFVERFQREARAAAGLDHPNIVTVYDIGEDGGSHFYSMALIEGESLDRRVRRQGKLPVMEAVWLMVQAVEGLAYAWERSIVHRDIKPGNLMVTQQGVLKVADFGLARPMDQVGTITQTGQSVGTPYYMSPEQGANAKDVNFRADEYSLGATFYHLVTGRVPFEGSSPIEVAVKTATAPLPPVRSVNAEVPPAVASVIEKMLARHKEDRYGTVQELVDALRGLTQSPAGEVANGVALTDRAPERVAASDKPSERSGLSAEIPSAVELVLTYPGKWFLMDLRCNIFLDDELIGTATVKKGFNLSFPASLGAHRLVLAGGMGGTAYNLKFDEPGRYELHLDYSRTWAKWVPDVEIHYTPP